MLDGLLGFFFSRECDTKVLEALPDDTLEAAHAIEAEYMERSSHLQAERALGSLPTSVVDSEHEELSDEYLGRLVELLEGVEFLEEGWCTVHEQMCPYSPRLDEALRDCLWIDGAGSTCVAWSRAGKRGGLLHPSCLVMCAWILHRRFSQPDLIVHECTPSFPSSVLRDLLNRRMSEQLKCVWARPVPGASEVSEMWFTQSVSISPKQLGVPVSRERLYTLMLWSPFAGLRKNGLQMMEIHGEDCAVDAEIFFDVESPEMLPDGRGVPGFGVLGGGDASRLEGYKVRLNESQHLISLF